MPAKKSSRPQSQPRGLAPSKGASGRPTGSPRQRAKPDAAPRPGRTKPAATQDHDSDADSSPQRDRDAPQRIRLQRALAAAGFGSRRQCEELIVEGRVEVDGQIVDQLGTTIDWSTSKVYVDGTPLKPRRLVYFAVNKPTGVVTTNSDPEGRPRVIDLVPPEERVFPVGRLDRSSEGLILLTNDGDLAQHLAHPRFEVTKVYRVTVAGNVQPDTIRQMQQGIYIAEGLVKVEGARVLKARPRATEMEITLKEGKNREIRRILARLGHKVQTLKRIAIGPLRLGEMPTGAYRRLTTEEIKKLKQSTEAADRSAADGPSARRSRPAAGGKKRPAAKGSAKPVASRKGASTSRPASGASAGGRTGKVKRTLPQGLPNLSLPNLVSGRTGAVIGADPVVEKKEAITVPRSKAHIVRPRPTRQGTGGKPAAQGRKAKPPARGTMGRKNAAGPSPAGKPRPGARRKKGS